jgi:hypothetical protein
MPTYRYKEMTCTRCKTSYLGNWNQWQRKIEGKTTYCSNKCKIAVRGENIVKDGKRICSNCSIEKDLYDFHTDKRKTFGATAVCKTCANSKSKIRRENDRKPMISVNLI